MTMLHFFLPTSLQAYQTYSRDDMRSHCGHNYKYWEPRVQASLWRRERAPTWTPQSWVYRWCRSNFAFLHELLGLIFDEKAFHDAFPKVMLEYTKKCDPDLPFYHYTGGNERYNPGCLPSFNRPSGSRLERLDRVIISRRSDPGVFMYDRASIPQTGQLTARAAHFKPAECLPPAPPPTLASWKRMYI